MDSPIHRAPDRRRGTLRGIPRGIDPSILELLFDRMPDIVFFVKNRRGEYVRVNETLVERCQCRSKSEILGRTTLELYDEPFGSSYHRQDRRIIERGVEILDRLELHLHRKHTPGWCITHKVPLRAPDGEVEGLIGVSKDLQRPSESSDHIYSNIARVVESIQERYDEPWKVEQLAREAGLTRNRFERFIRRIYGITPGQLLAKTRLQAATRLLRETPEMSVAEVAHACGYYDHSAFSRQFKAVVGVTPSEFRQS